MEDLLKEMEEYRDFLVDQRRSIIGSIARVNISLDNVKIAGEYMDLLAIDYRGAHSSIALIEFHIKALKKNLEKEKEGA